MQKLGMNRAEHATFTNVQTDGRSSDAPLNHAHAAMKSRGGRRCFTPFSYGPPEHKRCHPTAFLAVLAVVGLKLSLTCSLT